MMSNEEFKASMKRQPLENPSPEFSNKVMKEVREFEDIHVNDFLKDSVQRSTLAMPDRDFTYKIIDQIQRTPAKTVIQPILPTRVWLAACSTMILLIGYSFNGSTNAVQSDHFFMDGVAHSIGQSISLLGRMSWQYLAVIFSSSLLLVAELAFRSKLVSKQNSM